MKTSIMAF